MSRSKYRPKRHWGSTPGWWVREFMTQPQRAKVRRLERAVVSGKVDAEEAIWPHGRKPHIYYW